MTTYQGPHASVRQEFVTSPAGVAIDNLPAAIVATAFDVYTKELLGTHYGIINQQLAWIGDNNENVVYSKEVINQRAFDFYPATVFTDSLLSQDPIDLELDIADLALAGATIERDEAFPVPGVAKAEGVCKATLPFYQLTASQIMTETVSGVTVNHLIDAGETFTGVLVGDLVVNTTLGSEDSARITNIATGDLTLDKDIIDLGTDTYRIVRPIKNSTGALQILEIPNGNVGNVKPGQNIFLKTYDLVAGWQLIGVVSSVGSNPTRLTMSGYGATQVAGVEIVIGAGLKNDGTIDATLLTYPNTIWDPDGLFVTNKVERGDILKFSSLALSGSAATPRTASVREVINNNMITFNTQDLTVGGTLGKIDYDFSRYEFNNDAPGSTVSISSYDIERLVGFSQNYAMKEISTGVKGTYISTSSFSVPYVFSTAVPRMLPGDIFMLTSTDKSVTTNDRDLDATMVLYRIATIENDDADSKWIITANEVIKDSADGVTPIAAGTYFIHAWTPSSGNGRELNILADYRSFRSNEQGVVKRITQQKDIFDNFVRADEDTIDPRNELAFMLDVAFQLAGQKPVYAVNVSETGYADAMEELKLYDVYSHAFGTTGLGVTEVAAYCNGQSEPYEGHERIATLCYDQLDVYNMGADSGSRADTGVITISGTTFNPLTAGLTVNDKVRVFDSSDNFIEEVTVTATPTTTTSITTNGTLTTGTKFRFQLGRKAAQANAAGAIAGSQRRVTNIWPGYFTAQFDGDIMTVPPYFITAAIAGLDSSQKVSQSLTNFPYTIPALSNFELNTDTYFNKTQLDSIGGGGVDIMIKSGTAIRSRHDLTSDMSSVQFRERSITKQADLCAKTIRAAVAPYVGRHNISTELFRFLGSVISIASSKLVKDGIIASLTMQSIARDEAIDDKINIYMKAIAFIAGNYFDITLLVSTR